MYWVTAGPAGASVTTGTTRAIRQVGSGVMLDDSGPRQALDHHLDVARGELQVLDHAGGDTELIDVAGLGLIDLGVALGREQDLLVWPAEGTLQRDH